MNLEAFRLQKNLGVEQLSQSLMLPICIPTASITVSHMEFFVLPMLLLIYDLQYTESLRHCGMAKTLLGAVSVGSVEIMDR